MIAPDVSICMWCNGQMKVSIEFQNIKLVCVKYIIYKIMWFTLFETLNTVKSMKILKIVTFEMVVLPYRKE